jgi:hypothetical protein
MEVADLETRPSDSDLLRAVHYGLFLAANTHTPDTQTKERKGKLLFERLLKLLQVQLIVEPS